MKLKALKTHFNNELQVYPLAERQVLFQMICEAHMGLKPHDLVLNYETAVSISTFNFFKSTLNRLKNHEPIQYILGKAHFFGAEFLVNPSVLIPRLETQELVALVLEDFPADSVPIILDLGTGSGCIAIALAKALPKARVFAVDKSPDALEVAQINAKRNAVDITLMEADLLNWEFPDQYFDIIVSNPPYVCKKEQSLMAKNVLAYEPHLALFVADDSPLVFYSAIKNILIKNLQPKGFCYLEINAAFGKDTQKLFKSSEFQNTTLLKDTFGKDRLLKIQKK